jgi:hypothetical protein
VLKARSSVRIAFARSPNGLTCIHDPELFTVFGHHAHLWHAYPFVNARDRRAPEIRTTTASITCSYFCTSIV